MTPEISVPLIENLKKKEDNEVYRRLHQLIKLAIYICSKYHFTGYQIIYLFHVFKNPICMFIHEF